MYTGGDVQESMNSVKYVYFKNYSVTFIIKYSIRILKYTTFTFSAKKILLQCGQCEAKGKLDTPYTVLRGQVR